MSRYDADHVAALRAAVPRGERRHAARLNETLVREIRDLHDEGEGLCVKCLSILYGVSYGTVWDAVNYNTWAHVK